MKPVPPKSNHLLDSNKLPDSFIESFPESLQLFVQQSIPSLRNHYGAMNSPMEASTATDVSKNRDPLFYLAKAFIFFMDGNTQQAVQEATLAKLLAPGSRLLQTLPFYFQHPDLVTDSQLRQLITSIEKEKTDPLDKIITKLSKAEKKGRIRIHLSAAQSEHEEILTSSKESYRTDEEDFTIVTPTYLAILEEQEKYEEALALIHDYLSRHQGRFSAEEEKFKEIRTRIEQKLGR